METTTLDALASAAKVAAKAQAKAEAAQDALAEAVAHFTGKAEDAAEVLGVSVRTYWRMRKAGSPAPTPVKVTQFRPSAAYVPADPLPESVAYNAAHPDPTPRRDTCEVCWDAGAYGGCVECGKVEP